MTTAQVEDFGKIYRTLQTVAGWADKPRRVPTRVTWHATLRSRGLEHNKDVHLRQERG